MTLEIELTKTAIKDLKKLNKTTAKQILRKLEYFAEQKNALKYAVKLTNPKKGGSYRFRIGQYRAVFEVSKNKMLILYIEHRRDVYRN